MYYSIKVDNKDLEESCVVYLLVSLDAMTASS